jgi:chromosome segregation ATPase
MNQDSETTNLQARINTLLEQRNRLHRSLGEFLEDALDWAESGCPELIPHVAALSERTNALLAQIEHAQTELDRIEKAGAEEYVKNYIVKPGSK